MILDDYRAQGYDLSLRQLFYQCVSKNILTNTERSYKMLGALVSDARLAGLLDWDMIKDRGRVVITNPHWGSPGEIVRACAEQYRVDMWETQDRYVEVFVEKQALEGVLIPVCRKWDVPFTANKGYSSSSAMYDAGMRIVQRLNRNKKIVILYLGDHDPSGIDMTRDVRDRLMLFTGSYPGDDELLVERVALNMNQVEELNPPENPAKMTDSRAQDYISKFGTSSWELDAIEPEALAKMVERAITAWVDFGAWSEQERLRDNAKEKLREVADTL